MDTEMEEASQRAGASERQFAMAAGKVLPSGLTAFLGYKAGMTHIVREAEKPGSKTRGATWMTIIVPTSMTAYLSHGEDSLAASQPV